MEAHKTILVRACGKVCPEIGGVLKLCAQTRLGVELQGGAMEHIRHLVSENGTRCVVGDAARHIDKVVWVGD